MQNQEPLDISQILGMVIALIAMAYVMLSTILELFFKRKRPPATHHPRSAQEFLKEILKDGGEEELENVHQEEDSEERDEGLQELPSRAVPPPPPSLPAHKNTSDAFYQGISAHPEEKFTFKASLDTFKTETAIDRRHLDIHLRAGEDLISESIKKFGPDDHFSQKKKCSRLQYLVQKFPSKRSLIIAREIIDPPLSLRKHHDWNW